MKWFSDYISANLLYFAGKSFSEYVEQAVATNGWILKTAYLLEYIYIYTYKCK